MNNNEIFEQFWKTYTWPEESQPVEYRIYYDPDTGAVLQYSTEELEGAYIVVEQEVYNKYNHQARVVDGELRTLTSAGFITKLVPGKSGWHAHPDNVELIVNRGKQWELKQWI